MGKEGKRQAASSQYTFKPFKVYKPFGKVEEKGIESQLQDTNLVFYRKRAGVGAKRVER